MEAKENSFPLIGDKLPEMTVQTTHGEKKLPEDYKGKWLVLFSHPADFTPVCTTEFMAFAKRKEKFDALNAELLGLSIDQIFSHIKWDEWIEENMDVQIPFPIIADMNGSVAGKLGMVHPGKGSTGFRAYLINSSTYHLYYVISLKRGGEDMLYARGKLEPDLKIELNRLVPEKMDEEIKLKVGILFYGTDFYHITI